MGSLKRIGVVSFATAALLVGACGSDSKDSGGGTTVASSSTSAAAGTPKKGGTITIGVEAETDRFDPGNGNIGFPARAIHHLVYGSLTAATPDGKWVPYLAESVTGSDDAKVWTVKLRQGMTFQDGTAFDATNVKASMDRIRLESLSKDAFSSYITGVDKVDDLTVKITLNKSYGVFPQILSDEFGAIVSTTATAKYGDSYGEHPTGAGPYKVVEYVRDDHLTLERFDGYFMKDTRGWADRIIFKPIPDDAARSAALRAGDVDVIATSNPSDIVAFRGDSKFRVHEVPNGASGVLFNVQSVPDVRVRKAVAMAMDKKALIDLVWNGVGDVVDSPIAKDSFWNDPAVKYPTYDPAGAKALVDEVAKETGKPVTLEVLSAIDQTNSNFKVALAEQLKAVGIDVQIASATDVNDYVDRYINSKFQVTTAGVFGVIDPWFEYTRRYYSSSPLNGSQFEDPELDKNLDIGATSTSPDERKKAYDKVQEILADNLVQLFVRSSTYAIITNDKIEGWGTLKGPDGQLSLGNYPQPIFGDEYWRSDA